MKSIQIKQVVGLALFLTIAIVIDLAYHNVSDVAGQTFDMQQMVVLFRLRPLITVVFYTAFFIVAIPTITSNYSNHLQTWIIIVVGLVILIPITFPITRFLPPQILSIASSHLQLTNHFGAILTALGLFRLFQGVNQKKQV